MSELPIDALKDLPGYALRRASSAAMQKLARELAPLDLRPSEARIPANQRAAFVSALQALWDSDQ